MTACRMYQMFGARKLNDAQIAFRTNSGELDKGRGVNSRTVHSAKDCQRIDRVQGRAASLRMVPIFARLNFVQIRI